MSFVNKMKDFFGVGGDDYYDGNDEEYISKNNDRDYEEDEPARPEADAAAGARKNKVVNINTTTQLRVVLVKPERFADASTIADHLNAKRTVVLNLESTNKEVSRRLVDFLSGVAYANNGEMKRVAASTYIVTPFNVDIVGDLLDELENSGAFLN